MPYVSKDDIMAYIPSGVSLSQSVSTQIDIILYKDYINNQLNIAEADAVTVTLYNSIGQKTYQYSNPVITGQTNRLTLGSPASATQGYITFDVTAQQAANMAAGDIFAQVTITYSNYYPRAKTYVIPQLLIGDNNLSSVPGGGSGNGGGANNAISATAVAGSVPTIDYNVGAIDGSVPSVGEISFNSATPSAVTEITFYNLDSNNMRNVLLENYLITKLDNGVSGTITIIDRGDSKQYTVYNVTSYIRVNSEAGGGDDNDNDLTKITVAYEDSSYSPISNAHTFIVGQSISYDIDAYGGAGGGGGAGTSGTSGTSGLAGVIGTSGTDGTSGLTGADGTSGLTGADGTSGLTGADGTSGTDGTSGLTGADGTSGNNGIDGSSGTAGTSGNNGIDGSSGTDGTSGNTGAQGADGTSGTSGNNGADGTSGNNGAQGADGTSGTSGNNGAQGAQGDDGTSGNNGADGTSGTSGNNGAQGAQGADGADGTSGNNGADGTSGTSGNNGADGTSGSSGNNGAQGAQGADGADGTSGNNGADGTSGSSGLTGADGTSGSSGLTGADGTSGSSGLAGVTGAAGTSGSSGNDGTDGVGIPSGGTSGQVLTKVDASLNNVTWSDATGASGAGYTKYMLRLNYDSSDALIAGTSSHTFQAKAGYETTGSSVTSVSAGATGSISVSFSGENNPPIGIMIMAWQPIDDTYKVHHYDKDAANLIINTSSANFTPLGSNQYEPNFFGAFTTSMTIDTRLDFIKIGTAQSTGFPPVYKNAHAYIIFIF